MTNHYERKDVDSARDGMILRIKASDWEALQQRVRELEEAAIQLHSALAAHTCYGCPRCPGDCSSANPPVLDCPTQRAIEAYRTFDAALKADTHD